jgi:hypothetical protein
MKPFSRDPHFWYLNEDVFLQLHGVRFKLEKRQLARQSTFFADLFSQRLNYINQKLDAIQIETGDSSNVRVDFDEVNGIDLYHIDETGVALTDFRCFLHLMEDPQ